jgi:hypothetical protein
MEGYVFLDTDPGYRADSYLVAWRSILGREEIAKVKRKSQEMYEWARKSESDGTDPDDESG